MEVQITKRAIIKKGYSNRVNNYLGTILAVGTFAWILIRNYSSGSGTLHFWQSPCLVLAMSFRIQEAACYANPDPGIPIRIKEKDLKKKIWKNIFHEAKNKQMDRSSYVVCYSINMFL